MQGIKRLVVITNRTHAEEYLSKIKEYGTNAVFCEMAEGTATDKIIEVLGFTRTEKVMLTAFMVEDDANKALDFFRNEEGTAGNGISFLMSTDGFGGESTYNYLLGDKKVEKKESDMNNDSKFVLIVSIVDKGNTDLVMNPAREAGASGGTVTKARGTGADISKFFGVSISEEKEIIYIVSRRELRDKIMKAIMSAEGFKEKAHGIVFSLPVESVSGVKIFND